MGSHWRQTGDSYKYWYGVYRGVRSVWIWRNQGTRVICWPSRWACASLTRIVSTRPGLRLTISYKYSAIISGRKTILDWSSTARYDAWRTHRDTRPSIHLSLYRPWNLHWTSSAGPISCRLLCPVNLLSVAGKFCFHCIDCTRCIGGEEVIVIGACLWHDVLDQYRIISSVKMMLWVRVPPEHWGDFESKMRHLSAYGWLVVTTDTDERDTTNRTASTKCLFVYPTIVLWSSNFRVSPSQKAEVVSLVRQNIKDTITLAIGDGANDVAMIQVSSGKTLAAGNDAHVSGRPCRHRNQWVGGQTGRL